jgi:hypothetical protein
MVTLLECNTEEQSSVISFFCAKGLDAKDIHKDMFQFAMGSVYRIKQFTTGWQTFR